MCAQKKYDGVNEITIDVAPKGNFKSDKQHSGTPGLIQRGNGKWAVPKCTVTDIATRL